MDWNLESIITIKNEVETRDFGLRLGMKLKAGDIVAIIGDLGAGKTTLTKSIAEGLGIKEMITSPTFTIVQEYHSGRVPLYHFDVYRIDDVEEMYELGYEEYFFGDGVSVVEWANKIMEIIPQNSVIIEIAYGTNLDNPDERKYKIKGKHIE